MKHFKGSGNKVG